MKSIIIIARKGARVDIIRVLRRDTIHVLHDCTAAAYTRPIFDWHLQSTRSFQLKRTQWRAINAFRHVEVSSPNSFLLYNNLGTVLLPLSTNCSSFPFELLFIVELKEIIIYMNLLEMRWQ
jgi:hypothetical protein